MNDVMENQRVGERGIGGGCGDNKNGNPSRWYQADDFEHDKDYTQWKERQQQELRRMERERLKAERELEVKNLQDMLDQERHALQAAQREKRNKFREREIAIQQRQEAEVDQAIAEQKAKLGRDRIPDKGITMAYTATMPGSSHSRLCQQCIRGIQGQRWVTRWEKLGKRVEGPRRGPPHMRHLMNYYIAK